ncbi:MAG: transporter substrate-binding domain-containing protein [Bilophila sp.]
MATQIFLVPKAMQDNLFERNVHPVDAIVERQTSILGELSPKERAWLDKHHTVRVGIAPRLLSDGRFDAEGRYTGIGPHYLRILQKVTGLTFHVAPPVDWTDTTDMAENKKVDMYIAAAGTHHRAQYMLFTPSYIAAGIIVTRQPTPEHPDAASANGTIKDLAGKRVACGYRD